MNTHVLEGGFEQPAIQSAHAFRAVMEAMARPGTIQDIAGAVPPAPMSPAAGAVVLTLCDTDTSIYLARDMDNPKVREWIAFHTGAPIVDQSRSMFALGSWQALQPLTEYPIGTPEYPDRSATLIVEVAELDANGAELRGPGIKDCSHLSVPDIDALAANHLLFPLGLDFMFTSGDQIAALPRSTEVTPCT